MSSTYAACLSKIVHIISDGGGTTKMLSEEEQLIYIGDVDIKWRATIND